MAGSDVCIDLQPVELSLIPINVGECGRPMNFEHLLSRIALALGIGLLIGLERGWRTREAEAGSRTAGIRTFAISGLLGGIVGAIAQSLNGPGGVAGGIVLAVSFATYAAVITVFSREENRADETYSATTAVAGMLTFALGAYALVGDVLIAAGAAIAAAGLLASREALHGWIEEITWPELRSGLVLLAMTFIALPVVPNHPIGPFGGFNPREVWIIAIVLAGVSFAGYAATKYFGASRGILIAAAAGGLVSSTAVTIANARRAIAREGAPHLLAAGVAIATAMSFLRVFAITTVLQPRLLITIGPALVAAIAAAIGFGTVSAARRAGAPSQQNMQFHNPFGFLSVIGFAVSLSLIIVVGRVAGEKFGAAGAAATAIVIGFADVDSVTVSLAHMTPDPLTIATAAYAILAAVASNTLGKVAIGAIIGRGLFAAEIGAMAALCFVAGGLVLSITYVTMPR
jgi:uncharacterized membrane protein (DUF4010 family)